MFCHTLAFDHCTLIGADTLQSIWPLVTNIELFSWYEYARLEVDEPVLPGSVWCEGSSCITWHSHICILLRRRLRLQGQTKALPASAQHHWGRLGLHGGRSYPGICLCRRGTSKGPVCNSLIFNFLLTNTPSVKVWKHSFDFCFFFSFIYYIY